MLVLQREGMAMPAFARAYSAGLPCLEEFLSVWSGKVWSPGSYCSDGAAALTTAKTGLEGEVVWI